MKQETADQLYSLANGLGFQQTYPKLYEIVYCLLYGKKITKEQREYFLTLQCNIPGGFGYVTPSVYNRIKNAIN